MTQNWNRDKCAKGNRKAGPYPPKVERGSSSVGFFLGSSICGMKNLAQACLQSVAEEGGGSWGTSPPHQKRQCTCGTPMMIKPYFDGAGRNTRNRIESGQGQLGQKSHSSCPGKCLILLWWNQKNVIVGKVSVRVHVNRDTLCILGLFYFQIRRVINVCRKMNHLSLFYLQIVSRPLLWILRSLLHTGDHSIQKAVHVNIWKGSYFNSNSLFCF